MRYHTMFDHSEFGGLATDILCPSSSPIRDSEEEHSSLDEFLHDDFEERIFQGIGEFLSRDEPTTQTPTSNHGVYDEQVAEHPPEMPPTPNRSESQDGQNTEVTFGATPAPTEITQFELEEPRAESACTAHDTAYHPTPSDSETEDIYLEPIPQKCAYSRGQQLPSAVPMVSSSDPRSYDPRGAIRTQYENSPVLPVKRPQTNTAGVDLIYRSSREAEQAMQEHLNHHATDDYTVPQTDTEKAEHVAMMFLAIIDTSRVPEPEEGTRKPQAIKSFEEGKYLDWQIQMVCWRILDQCILRQRSGPLVPPWQRTRKPKDFDYFRQRFEVLCEALRCEKQLCKRLMAAYLIDDFVDDPTSYVKRIQQNKSLNDKKKDQIKLGRAAQAASASNTLRRGAGRKRKAPEDATGQAQPAKKRGRRPKLQDGLQFVEQLPSIPGQGDTFPLDPALSALPQEEPSEEWDEWVNYSTQLAGHPTAVFNPAQVASGDHYQPHQFLDSTVNYQPTIRQFLEDPYSEPSNNLPYPSHHAPHQQEASTVSPSVEEEDWKTNPSRKRRRSAKG
ncbi:hypothetical protein FGG08_000151 [Glutinoglossum americanum]|uniref:Uncharacterized protein n=1 Tax=Glutinoglossum americanum TaxID=1670608 RepID=A0A9P8IIG7_9PEZI|nr:hypothetical protein FGG08_000151 [Glutinoglossum americanum]